MPSRPKRWGLERRKAHCRAEQGKGRLVLRKPRSSMVWGNVLWAGFEGRAAGVRGLPVGGGEVPGLLCSARSCILHLGGALVPEEELRDTAVQVPGRSQDCSEAARFCLCTPPFPDDSCWSLPFGTRGRSGRLKPFSYRQETGDTERLLYPGGPHRVLLRVTSAVCAVGPLVKD